jgi:hypothetical protein
MTNADAVIELVLFLIPALILYLIHRPFSGNEDRCTRRTSLLR